MERGDTWCPEFILTDEMDEMDDNLDVGLNAETFCEQSRERGEMPECQFRKVFRALSLD